VSATVGVASLRLGDAVGPGGIVSTWRTWWLGDMTGDMLAAPLVMAAVTRAREWVSWSARQAGEAVVVVLLVAGVAVLAFAFDAPREYIVFPALIVAALRFRQVGAAIAVFVVTAFAVAFTAHGDGPFAHNSPDTSLLLSQTFMAVAGITALLLAAITTERERAVETMLRVRQDEALAIHDEVVQGLAVATYAMERGSDNVARQAIDDALLRSRALVSELLDEGSGTVRDPGSLRLAEPGR
jgi:integral membrane sensor domain MASE1